MNTNYTHCTGEYEMKHTIVAATQNKHKIVEIEAITKEFGMDIISRDEAGVPDIEIVENGKYI